MIPYAILQGELYTEKNMKIEISIQDLSFDSFTFRLLNSRAVSENCHVILYFFSYETTEYQKVELGITPVLEEKDETVSVYRVIAGDPAFKEAALRLMKEYRRYYDLKLHAEDGELSEEMTGYPASKEKTYASSVREWLQRRIPKRVNQENWQKIVSTVTLGIELSTEESRKAFLQMSLEDFRSYYFAKQGLQDHPLSNAEIQYVYLGDGYCMHRMPAFCELEQLLEKAGQEGMQAVIVLPALKERDRISFCTLLEQLASYARRNHRKFEVVVNDWGTAEMIRQNYADVMTMSLGILINKRRKDSRMQWRLGSEKQMNMLKENSSNEEEFRKYLKERYQISSAVYETCGYTYILPENEQVIYFPYYQMNTAGHCTLYAACHNGDRSMQMAETDCSKYCREYMFMYPEFLNMIGFGSSVFAWDNDIFADAEYFEQFSKAGKHRMVLMELYRGGSV